MSTPWAIVRCVGAAKVTHRVALVGSHSTAQVCEGFLHAIPSMYSRPHRSTRYFEDTTSLDTILNYRPCLLFRPHITLTTVIGSCALTGIATQGRVHAAKHASDPSPVLLIVLALLFAVAFGFRPLLKFLSGITIQSKEPCESFYDY
jgi:hypothetical protein